MRSEGKVESRWVVLAARVVGMFEFVEATAENSSVAEGMVASIL